MIFGSIIAAGVIGIFIAPLASRMLRFFPPVVTGTIIAVIGITLMRVGIWLGAGFGPTAPMVNRTCQWLTDPALANSSRGCQPRRFSTGAACPPCRGRP